MPAPASVTIPNDTDIVIVRTFDAPRELVWRAHTEPQLMKRWMQGPPGWTLSVCEIDARPGGKFRNVFTQAGQQPLEVRGTFLEVDAPARWVHTEEYGPEGSSETPAAVETLVLTEKAGKTTLTLTMRYPSKEARDAAGQGTADGMEECYRRIDVLLNERMREPTTTRGR
ncbi:MAG: SRPBCC family protein [Myxococcaceae bacterium]|nr:SRPBCC family protein [Myxococcaceae bacterium]